jgi:hypothetical protein
MKSTRMIAEINDLDDETITVRPDRGTKEALKALGLIGRKRAEWLRAAIREALRRERRERG